MDRERIIKIARLTGMIMGVYLVFRFVLPLIIPFIIAMVIALSLDRCVCFFERKGIKRSIASAFIIIVVSLLVTVGMFFAGRQLYYEAVDLKERYQKQFGYVYDWICEQCGTSMSALLPYAATTCRFFVDVFVTLLAAVLISDRLPHIRQRLRQSREIDIIRKMYEKTYKVGLAYVRTQLIIMAITSVICTIGIYLSGNRHGLLLGVGIGLLDALPMIGCGVVLVPWTVLLFIFDKYFQAAVIFTTFVVAYIVRQIMEPKIMGDSVGVSPLEILVSVFIGIKLFGLLGVILGPIGHIIIKTLADSCNFE